MNCQNLHLPRPLDDLPRFTHEQATMINRLGRRRQPWHGHWNGQPLTLLWEPSPPTPATWIAATWGDAPLEVAFPDALLTRLGVSDGQGQLGAMTLEAALLTLIEPLESLSGCTFRFQPRASGFVPLITWQFTLALEERWLLRLALGAKAAEHLADLLALVPQAPATFAALPLTARVSLADLPLTLGEVRSLRPGDILLLGRDNGPLRLECAGRRASVARQGRRLTLLEPLQPMNPRTLHTMSDTPEVDDADLTLDELELTVSCQIGRLALSLGQLQALGEGSVLDLGGRDDQVELLANGRRIGRGQLVRLGEGLGVRVLSFAGL